MMTRVITTVPLVGGVAKQRILRSLAITETTYSPNLVIEKHAHPFPYFCAVLQGTFVDSVGSTERLFQNSSVFFRPAQQVHADRFQRAGARCLAVELKPELRERVEGKLLELESAAHFSGGIMFAIMRRLQGELERWDEFSSLSAEGLLYELLSEAGRPASVGPMTGPPWLRKVIELITNHFTESLTLTGIADVVRVHPTHLARVFRKFHRCTIGDYIRRQRIRFCCERVG